MDKVTHKVRLADWTEIVKQCQSRPSGMTVRDWLLENGINEKLYYFWQRQVRQEAFNKATALTPLQTDNCEVSFAKVPRTACEPVNDEISPAAKPIPDAVIRTESMEIEIHNSLSPMMLKSILEVAAHAC